MRGFILSFFIYQAVLGVEKPKNLEAKPIQLKRASTLIKEEKKGQQLATKIVGIAADQVVTSREVQLVHAIGRVLNSEPIAEVIKSEDPRFNLEVAQVLLEIVVQQESMVFDFNQLTEREVKEAMDLVQKGILGIKDFKLLEMTSAELDRLLKRKLISGKFIKVKSDSMKGFITDAEAKDYFDKNRLKFGQVSFGQFKENIKNFLGQQQLEDRLKAWFEIIKKKYKVKNYTNEFG